MTHRLITNFAKNYCNRTLIVKVIVENVVTCFLGTRCTGWPKKTSGTFRNYNSAYTLWAEISFGTFVDPYVLLLTYKFQ